MPDAALLIHSTGLGPFMWAKLRDAVPTGLAVLAPANAGYPPHPPLERGAPFGLADELAVLTAAIPDDIEGVHLVGHSYSGLIALHLAQALGARTRSLWLFEPTLLGTLVRERASLSPEARTDMDLLLDSDRFATDAAHGGTEAWIANFVDFWNAPGTWARMSEKGRAASIALGWKMYREAGIVGASLPFADYRVTVPLTLVSGGRSPAFVRPTIAGLAAVNPHAHVVELPDAVHMAPFTHPADVAPTIAAHFARCAVAGGTAG